MHSKSSMNAGYRVALLPDWLYQLISSYILCLETLSEMSVFQRFFDPNGKRDESHRYLKIQKIEERNLFRGSRNISGSERDTEARTSVSTHNQLQTRQMMRYSDIWESGVPFLTSPIISSTINGK